MPTSPELVEKMLDMAKVTAADIVMDLGSGDGRNIIAAAKRGATATGFEFNHDMVELSRRQAAAAGVADKATFVEGDMYEADISKATVLALFSSPQPQHADAKFLSLAGSDCGHTFARMLGGDEPRRAAARCEWCTRCAGCAGHAAGS